MLNEKELKYIQKEIQKNITIVERTYSYEYLDYKQNPGSEEYPGYTETLIERRIKEIYNLIRVYLEAKELHIYLADFTKKYHAFINDPNSKLLEAGEFEPDSDSEIKIIHSFKDVLDPFLPFDYLDKQEEDYQHLINILQHTGYILKNIKTPITNEADIYKAVQWVLHLYYPKLKKTPKSFFSQHFKFYEPDLLIPELGVAVEYKYIRDNKKTIDDYIDEVRNDATNYDGDPKYDKFVAVICIKDLSIATTPTIRAAWDQKKFPKNWDLVIVIGI